MKNLIMFVLSLVITSTWTIAQTPASLKIDWNKSITNQIITSVSSIGNDVVTTSIPSSVTGPGFKIEINKWSTTGTPTKVTEITGNTTPSITGTTDKMLVYTIQSEPVRLFNAAGQLTKEATIAATLQLTKTYEANSKFFFVDNKIVRATYGKEVVSGKWGTRIEFFDQALQITSTLDFNDFEFKGITGKYIFGNVNSKGNILDLTNTNTKVAMTVAISDAKVHNTSVYALAEGKMYEYTTQLVAVKNKTIQGTLIQFIGERLITMSSNSAILYDSLMTSSIFSLSLPIVVGSTLQTSDAIYSTNKSLVRISYTAATKGNSGTGTGINDINEEKSLTLFPNPSSNVITIRGIHNPQIEIINLNGTIVLSDNHGNTMDISSLTPGVYLCKVNGLCKRFIKN